ncbi:MAG: DoxX family protein [Candidatus Sericytochromatia bacterium]
MLILRLLLGAVFIMHGSQKVFGWFDGHGLAGTAEMMAKMGTPAILAYLASFTEFFGGLALVFGLLTRMAALGIMCVMSVAIGQVHLSHGFFAPQGFEFPMTLGVIALVIFLLGPGRFSLDALFKRRRWL